MNHLKMSISILLLLTAIGCPTSYQPSGFGGGYSDTQLAPDVFRVVFRGNGHTDAERVQDFALLRASELTLQHGYVCFVLINEGSDVNPININTRDMPRRRGQVPSPEIGLPIPKTQPTIRVKLIHSTNTKPDF